MRVDGNVVVRSLSESYSLNADVSEISVLKVFSKNFDSGNYLLAIVIATPLCCFVSARECQFCILIYSSHHPPKANK